jgi:thioredoxin-related protein
MKKIIILTLLIIFTFSPSHKVLARGDIYKSIANFVYNMPKMMRLSNRNICVYGYDQVAVSLKEKHEDIIFFKNNSDLSKANFSAQKCQIFYISKNKNAESKAIELANKYKIISVGIDEDFIEKDGTILIQMGRRSFELSINHETMKALNIKLDPVLEGLVIN